MKIDKLLPSYIEELATPEPLKEAMLYSLKAGGKRIRPVLLLATIEAFGKDDELGLGTACALEMVHTYSLIHDDLPAMDDDDLRRGKPTNHKVFGEATAILAGDGLLTFSFSVISAITHPSITSDMKLQLIAKLACAAGPEGMVGGQMADMLGENRDLTVEELEFIHNHKTGDMLTYAVEAGAILAEASDEEIFRLKQFAQHVGLAFQIRDDILDVEGDQEIIGKPVGSDDSNQKSTYPQLLTMEGAKNKLNEHIKLAKEYLYSVNIKHSTLEAITDYIAGRDH
ncbi:polyprenyl synthetase family protein [Anaerobacillus sp. MEB173]|uniref:polyprenyl synthetase family protein n=1 Tax=Anaerobacillus sp. MEB173 TaxID=3383345 RepID=UPI003F8E3E63